MELKEYVRDVPDWPKKGIVFKDLTPLFKDPEAFRFALDSLHDRYREAPVDKVVGIEARGFIFAPTLAYMLGAGFVPVRKPKKLPWQTEQVTYELEYGTDTLEMHRDAIEPGENVLLIDDLLATGGTASAVVKLIERQGGNVTGIGFLVELGFLNGRSKLNGHDVYALIQY
ncbi:MAG: adenine phosphoribosyltransferase [Acidobacteria bacterium]|nr:adenine phosphoribosyltransferase [Acidobacteriota bacterium]